MQALQGILKTVYEYRASYPSQLTPDLVSAATANMKSDKATTELPPSTSTIAPDAEQPVRLTRDACQGRLAEFQGFCPGTIAYRNGILIPGDTNLGFVQFKEKLYCFASEPILLRFMENPTELLEAMLSIVRKRSELINLLDLTSHFPSVVMRRLLVGLYDETAPPPEIPAFADAQTETVLHIVEKNIDYNYDWNEWALRRKAIQLTNLRYKKTHSAQTDLSHFRRENETQTYLPKTQGTQQDHSTGTNPIRHMQYVAGLRGHPDQKMTVMNMTLEI
jgi:hypothetical protein